MLKKTTTTDYYHEQQRNRVQSTAVDKLDLNRLIWNGEQLLAQIQWLVMIL